MMRLQNTICFLIITSLLSACNTMPKAGPQNDDIKRHAKARITPQSIEKGTKESKNINDEYIIVDVNSSLIKKFQESHIALYSYWPEIGSAQDIKITIGDTLSISIYESSAGGLFIPVEAGIRPGNFVTLPNQIVDPEGYILVPYAGKIKADGLSAVEISRSIESKLKNIAIEPQIVVNIVDRNSEISVLGAVNNANRHDILFGGERILDSISKAGGPKDEGFNMRVFLQRNNVQYKISFSDLVDDPTKNIFLHSNDVVYLENDPDIFSIFGAIPFPGRYRFNSKKIFLSEAIALAGGLNDNQADPEEVFVYRHEYCPFVSSLKLSSDNTIKQNITCSSSTEDTTPVIYNINLRDPEGYLLAQNFKMQSEDVVYIGNSRSTELLKLLNIVNSSAVTTVNTRNATE